MTTQVASFLYFGFIFFVLYFFYKKEDRKKVLITCGIMFLVPFTFSYLYFPHDNSIPLWLLAVVLLIVFNYYKGKYRNYILPFIPYFIIIPLTTRGVTIINNEGKPIRKSIFTSSLDFTYKSGVRVIVPIEGGELINNTDSRLYVETVEYGTNMYGTESNNQIVKEIEPFTYTRNTFKIDYYFQDPPSSINISRKQGEPMPSGETKYWLHN